MQNDQKTTCWDMLLSFKSPWTVVLFFDQQFDFSAPIVFLLAERGIVTTAGTTISTLPGSESKVAFVTRNNGQLLATAYEAGNGKVWFHIVTTWLL